MPNSKAIVTLTVGDYYINFWRNTCQDSWQKYAHRYGYDIICIDAPLDVSERAQKRGPAWQKCLILSQEFAQKYERIVWLDADIVINHTQAPCITQGVPLEKVGAVKNGSLFTPDLNQLVQKRLHETAIQLGYSLEEHSSPSYFYTSYGLPGDINEALNTGVLVLSPQHHRSILEKVYYTYEEKGGAEWNAENRPLSYELLKANLVYWVDPRFNACWSEYSTLYYPFIYRLKGINWHSENAPHDEYYQELVDRMIYAHAQFYATTAFINNYFLHFAGCISNIDLVNIQATSWHDCGYTDPRVKSDILQIPPAILHYLADLYSREGKIDDAIFFLEKAIELEQRNDNIRAIPSKLFALGQLLAIQGNFQSGLDYLQWSLELLKKMDSPEIATAREVIIEILVQRWRQSPEQEIEGRILTESELIEWLNSLDNEMLSYIVAMVQSVAV